MQFQISLLTRWLSLLISIAPWAVCDVAPKCDAQELPIVLDPAWQLQLVATQPEIVTPISCRFDSAGRLLVVESHTHFPAPNYSGPKSDRIYLFDQLQPDDASGMVSSRKRLFYEGGKATMGLAILPDGWVAVSTRNEVFKIRDSDGDDVADQREVLLSLETKADYPHNGLGGLALGPDGLLYIGQGENQGLEYKLMGTDGSYQSGGGEGGNIFRCTQEGEHVQRYATGFWNPFGLSFDPGHRMFAVENDPDARPPCRLLQIIPGGDYGFQFRFGRSGTNPLLAWNGELPGTLPLVTGTGEAPCSVLPFDGALWVTSWGSNRIERYALEPKASSWSATMEVVIQGDAKFRPVDMAIGPDRSLYFTDWVDRSYNVHSQGRVWRLSKRDPASIKSEWPEASAIEKKLTALQSDAKLSVADRLLALEDSDPFVRQSAAFGLVQTGQLKDLNWENANTRGQQLGMLTAWRWSEIADPQSITPLQRSGWIDRGLASDFIDVKIAAVRWATERSDRQKLESIQGLLRSDNLSADLFACVVSSIAYLESGSVAQGQEDPVREKLIYDFATNIGNSLPLRTSAIRMLSANADKPTDQELGKWIKENTTADRDLGGEIVRLLAARARPSAWKELADIAKNNSVHPQVRADAVAGLVKNVGEFSSVLSKLTQPSQNEVVRTEAQRVMRRGRQESDQPPQPHDIQAWDRLLGQGGDAEAGRRVFFRTTCANCHSHSGRGSRVGPDLTKLAGQMSRERILESILQPSREVGPLYVPFRILTVDDKTLTGMRLEQSGAGDKMYFLGADGETFEVPLASIEKVEPGRQSIMPDGLEKTMSLSEFRDLFQFLILD